MLTKIGLIAAVGTVLGGSAIASANEPCVENTYQQPVYQQPVYQQPVYRQPVYQQPVVVQVPMARRVYRPIYRPVHYRTVWAGPHYRRFHRW